MPPVARGLPASGRPWNQRAPVQFWPASRDPFLIREPFAWWAKNTCPTPGRGKRVGQAEQDEKTAEARTAPAQGEHQKTPVAVRVRSMSLMKTNGAMIPPTP